MILGINNLLTRIGGKISSYVTDGLLQYFNFKNTSPELFLEGSTSFDGDDYIAVDGVISSLGTTTGTWCAWINNPDITSAESYFISAGDTNADEFIILTKDADGDLRAFLRDAGSNRWEIKTDSPAFINNTWHHVALRHNGTEPELFVDGAKPPQTFSVTTDKADWIPDCAGLDNLRIGHLSKGSSLGGYFTGLIANVGFWNRAITQNELLDLRFKNYADLSVSLKSGLISWYPLVSNANDSASSNNGTNNNATFLSSAYGRSSLFKPRLANEVSTLDYPRATPYSGRAVKFDGSNDWFSNTDDTNDFSFGDGSNDSPFSISAWINMTVASRFCVASKGVSDQSDWEWMLANSGSNMDFYLNDESENGSIYVTVAGATLASYVGKWTHVVATYDGSGNTSGMKVYLNAESQTVSSGTEGTYVAMENLNGLLWIGKERNFKTNGSINNFRIYSAELTLAQIKEIYGAPEQALPTGISKSNLKVYYPMQEGSGSKIFDYSDKDDLTTLNHGTLTGATWVRSGQDSIQPSLLRNREIAYMESGQKVSGTGTPALGEDWTVSAWIFTGDFGTSYSYYLRYNGSASNGISLTIDQSTGFLYSYPNPYGAPISFSRWNSFTFKENTLYHIAMVGSSSDDPYVKLYVDGDLKANNSDTGGTMSASIDITATPSELVLGSFASSYEPDKGFIDEITVWDTNLNATQVGKLSGIGYDPAELTAVASNLKGYWKNEGTNQWTDRSTNNNHLTPSGGTNVAMLLDGLSDGDGFGFDLPISDLSVNGARFNGDDYMMVYDSTQVDSSLQALDNNLTIECWIKPFEITGNDSGNYQSYYTIAELRTQTDGSGMSDGSGTHIPINLGINNSKLCFGVADNHTASQERIDTTASLTVNTWHHVAVTLNGNAYVIYINSVAKNSGSLSTVTGNRNVGTEISNLVIGARTTNAGATTGYYKGLIDEFRLYNSTLNAGQIASNYNHDKGNHS